MNGTIKINGKPRAAMCGFAGTSKGCTWIPKGKRCISSQWAISTALGCEMAEAGTGLGLSQIT
jgi:hypothetical protein